MYLPFLDPADRTISEPLSGDDSQRHVRVALTFLAVEYWTVAFFLPFSVDLMRSIRASNIPP
jgi:hypothetical protein